MAQENGSQGRCGSRKGISRYEDGTNRAGIDRYESRDETSVVVSRARVETERVHALQLVVSVTHRIRLPECLSLSEFPDYLCGSDGVLHCLRPGALGDPEAARDQLGQQIRDDGPKRHLAKSGTPTMGGMLIIFPVVLSTLSVGRISKPYVWLVMIATIGVRRDRIRRRLPQVHQGPVQRIVGRAKI